MYTTKITSTQSKMRFYMINLLIITCLILVTNAEHTRIKRRMYAMCPPTFQRIGSECYYISDSKLSWLDAHFECKDKNSKLAEPEKGADRKLRSYLQRNDKAPDEIWIGGTYDWNAKQWLWGYNGKIINSQSFSQIDPRSSMDLQFHCTAFNPQLKYRWSANPCVDQHRFMCQHKMPKVSAKNRVKIYNRWNETYPNQFANEVLLEILETVDNGTKTQRVRPVGSNDSFRIQRKQPGRRRRKKPEHVVPSYYPGQTYTAAPPAPGQFDRRGKRVHSNEVVTRVNDYLQADDVKESVAQFAPDQMNELRNNPRNRNKNKGVQNNDMNETIPGNNRPPKRRQRIKFDHDIEMKRKRAQQRRLHRKMKQEERERLKKEKEEERLRKQAEDREKIQKQEEERLRQMKELEELRRTQKEEQEKFKKQAEEEQRRQQEIERQRIEAENKRRFDITAYQNRLDEERKVRDELERRRLQESLEKVEKGEINEEQWRQQEEVDKDKKRLEEESKRRATEEYEREQEERRRQQEKLMQEELARISEEKRKREELEKARYEEIQRREQLIREQAEEERRIQEEIQQREDQERREREKEQRRAEEEFKKRHEEQLSRRQELEEKKKRKERRRQQYIKALRERQEEEFRREEEEARAHQKQQKAPSKPSNSQQPVPNFNGITTEGPLTSDENGANEKKKIDKQKFLEYLNTLTPEQQEAFWNARRERKRQKKNNQNNDEGVQQ